MRLTKAKKEELLKRVMQRHVVLPKAKELGYKLGEIYLHCSKQALFDAGIDAEKALQTEKEILKTCQDFEQYFDHKFHTSQISKDSFNLHNIQVFSDLSYTDSWKIMDILSSAGISTSGRFYASSMIHFKENQRCFTPADKTLFTGYLTARAKDFTTILHQIIKLADEYSTTLEDTKATINSANTVKQLIEAWPEVEDILPSDWLEKPKSNLPLPVLDKTNKALELPPE